MHMSGTSPLNLINCQSESLWQSNEPLPVTSVDPWDISAPLGTMDHASDDVTTLFGQLEQSNNELSEISSFLGMFGDWVATGYDGSVSLDILPGNAG
jgi:hypothetical protein